MSDDKRSQRAEDKVRRVYPDAYYESLFGGIKDRGNDDEWLSMRSLPPKSAWADAWRNILFTKERERKITEVEAEIDLLCKVWPAYYPSDSATMERIVDVEKARLAELKRGLREVPRG